MATVREQLESFHNFANHRLASDSSSMTIDQIYEEWRMQHLAEEEYATNVTAIQASIDDYQRGERGTELGGHSDELRREFGLDAS
ncbi:hypothetical protein [Calycomorphotria hydatis]|uniref:Uncharacterized protein n=1 Tax=Calycomorphotria hydatis TaxID=2528027 RepID=A0A517T510_9PLAN|nr:hypothetical protein [Calycomorphotria hydatis]QDT63459.1 hypothetical protein V22_06810 [Calycomorphotria hydatis]